MYTVYGTRKVMYVIELYRSVQRVYGNTVNMRVITLACCTIMQALRIVQLLYSRGTTVPHSGCTRPVVPVRRCMSGSYKIRTACVEQCRLSDSTFFGVLCCHAYFQNRAAMRIFEIIHLLYGLSGDPITCVHSLIKLCTYVCQRVLKIHIKEARKCLL